MAGAYLVTGFGTTYFGGRRDPGPFALDAEKNTGWRELVPSDELIRPAVPRGGDRGTRGSLRPPEVAYWALSAPGEEYPAYVRGTAAEMRLDLGARPRRFRVWWFNPRNGVSGTANEVMVRDQYVFKAPDTADWVLLLKAVR